MKNVIRLAFLFVLAPMIASAQNFQFAQVFPDSSLSNSHGLTVDANDNVWVGPYFSVLNFEIVDGDTTQANPVYIFDKDGALVKTLIGSEVGDSLLRFAPITGISSSVDGSRIYVSSDGRRANPAPGAAVQRKGSVWNSVTAYIHEFDAVTFETIAVYAIPYKRAETRSRTPNRAAVSEDGIALITYVFGGSPMHLVDTSDWSELLMVAEEKNGFSRTAAFSPDGATILNPVTANSGTIEVWVGDPFSGYELAAPLAVGVQSGAVQFYPPNPTIVYFAGAGLNNDPDALDPFISTRYYGISLESRQIVDTFDWNYGNSTTYKIPRAIDFSKDGLTVFVGSFTNGPGAVQKFTATSPTSIDSNTNELASGFELSQNFPNPFNPSTSINFTIADAGFTTLRVYDTLGRVVATLVNQELPAGQHTVQFNASALSSGIYLYELNSGNVRLTRSMTLVK
jgi:hypothetical protein